MNLPHYVSFVLLSSFLIFPSSSNAMEQDESSPRNSSQGEKKSLQEEMGEHPLTPQLLNQSTQQEAELKGGNHTILFDLPLEILQEILEYGEGDVPGGNPLQVVSTLRLVSKGCKDALKPYLEFKTKQLVEGLLKIEGKTLNETLKKPPFKEGDFFHNYKHVRTLSDGAKLLAVNYSKKYTSYHKDMLFSLLKMGKGSSALHIKLVDNLCKDNYFFTEFQSVSEQDKSSQRVRTLLKSAIYKSLAQSEENKEENSQEEFNTLFYQILLSCVEGNSKVAPDLEKKIKELIDKAAQENNTDSSVLRLKWAYGTLSDNIDSIKEAAERGYVTAQFKLGLSYEKGQGVAQSYNQAAKWWAKAAAQGHVTAQGSLGVCYYNGEGVAQNDEKAVEWWIKAANQGHMDAPFKLGVCFAKGRGVAQSDEKAVEWWTKAANQGSKEAQKWLAELEETSSSQHRLSDEN